MEGNNVHPKDKYDDKSFLSHNFYPKSVGKDDPRMTIRGNSSTAWESGMLNIFS